MGIFDFGSKKEKLPRGYISIDEAARKHAKKERLHELREKTAEKRAEARYKKAEYAAKHPRKESHIRLKGRTKKISLTGLRFGRRK